ncbi:MAG: hypothetical protein WKF58_06940 [Ilumatobacteraceae bacterium]
MSRAYRDGDTVLRGLNTEAFADFQHLAATRFFAAAVERGDIVRTEVVDGVELPDDWAGVLRHERIEVVSYPYEWPFEMLRDAALLQLRLTREAIAEKLITKDAPSYNVQFAGTRPVFIDIGSFERLRKAEPWPGYRQFCELFLNPLLVQAIRDVPFQPLLRGSVHGISPIVTADILGGVRTAHEGCVHPRQAARPCRTSLRRRRQRARRQGRAEACRVRAGAHRRPAEEPREGDRRTEVGQAALDVVGLRRPLALHRPRSRRQGRLRQGDDLGCRAGASSRARPRCQRRPLLRTALAAGASSVVAVDSDDLVVDRLYRDLREEGERRILPLVLDLSDPSPGLGWRSRERLSFVDRVRADLVLCLAVVHHLALTNTVPLDEIVTFLADLGAPIVVEFPHRDDPMASRLLARKREGVFDAYDLPNWDKALERQFKVHDRITLPSGTRTLYRCTPH